MVDRVGLRRFQSHLSAATDTNIPTVGQKHFIKDCVDGVEYKRITDKWVIRDDPNTICLTISAGTDGGSVNKSNSKSINPLFFWINEIGLKHRFSYPLTSLAAYANHKIPYQILLSKFIDELNELDKGLTIVTKGGCKFFLKVRLFQMIVDLVAAKDLLQINGHSGLCGCRWCLHTGEKKGENTGVLYCVGNSSCNSGVNRVWNNMMPQFCKLQKNEISSFDGVIGISILLKLSYFRWTTQVACDILHNLLEGLCKKILKNICSLYKTLIPSIDERIKLIETPSMYHREIRSLNEAAKFKAIEYYMLFAYCKDVFKNIISENHFNILKSVETFIGLIMNPSEKSEQAKASLLQMAFNLLRSVEIEFGEEDITMASHTVLHFPLSIWNLGPLYTNSTFMLEDLMGSLTSSIYGGKANMDHKALENWSIHQMTSLKRVRQFTFQYEHGLYLFFSKVADTHNV
ncbi:predicted protein [Naegleria gruberi]|uniref:Predicted protein n=1 Tax=Naegleria gruberi TaxID=5762 RepID=D2W405_NAEGR|nr:uncharacterized protein NAEGRDRAFT_76136 [Naegleria gruberi]EFC36228.1 predicted protein [Naegleria gruberi]|eukprot:XP_002668972.1 predicted protein [Naegleria gruberi strain NEG-M]